MTVKEAVSVLKRANEIKLVWCGDVLDFDKNNALMMNAYGNYVVDEVMAGFGEEVYEITVAVTPMKEGA